MKFWVDAMGFTPAANWGQAPRRAVMLDTGDGNYLEVFERESVEAPASEPPIFHMCFRTDDCDAAVERARASGAEVTVEPKTLDPFPDQDFPVRLAFIKGPDGEICEFFQNDVL